MPTIRQRPAITPETPYRPWTYRTIGVEMEFVAPGQTGDQVNRAITASGVTQPVRGNGASYHHSDGNHWDVKRDGSVAGGWEVATPAVFLDAQGHNADLQRGCAALERIGGTVNRACGLHVWVDCSDFDHEDLRRLMVLWARYEPFFYSLQPDSRWSNGYCAPLRQSTWMGNPTSDWTVTQRAINASDRNEMRRACGALDKYRSLKTCDWWVHGRVEFRLAAGTVNYEDIRRWAMLLLTVVERARGHRDAGFTEIRPTINQRDVALGFTVGHMTRVLGLAPAGLPTPGLAPEAATVRDWCSQRVAAHRMPTRHTVAAAPRRPAGARA